MLKTLMQVPAVFRLEGHSILTMRLAILARQDNIDLGTSE